MQVRRDYILSVLADAEEKMDMTFKNLSDLRDNMFDAKSLYAELAQVIDSLE